MLVNVLLNAFENSMDWEMETRSAHGVRRTGEKRKEKNVPRSRVRFVREGGQASGAQQLGKQLANAIIILRKTN